MSQSLQITEAIPGEVQGEQLKSIKSLLGPGETVHAVARVFSVDFNCYNEIVNKFGNVALWMPRVHHHWIAVTDTFLRVGDFAMYEIPEDYYRNSRALWNWWKIISYRSQYLTLPSAAGSEITRHTSVAFPSISEVHSDSAGTEAYVFDNLNYWEWRWVLDANGYESHGRIKMDGGWESPMPHLGLNRLIYTTAGYTMDLFSFHSSLKAVGEKLRAAMKIEATGQSAKKAKKRQSRGSASTGDHKDNKSIDVDALAKLAKLHKSGALTDDEFKRAKDNLLQ